MTNVLFLILNYKTYKDTARVVEELVTSGMPNIRILIVDNASPNNSLNILRDRYNGSSIVDVISSGENGGYAKGNNFGLRYAKRYAPEFVCVMNNDVHFTKETIYSLIDTYRILNKPAVISPVQYLPNNEQAKFPSLLSLPSFTSDAKHLLGLSTKFHEYVANTDMPNIQEVAIIPGAFLFIKYDVFEQIGFFDERTFLFCEERFLARKVKDSGFSNYLVLDLSYLHEHSKTISSEASEKKQRELIQEGRIEYAKKYYMPLNMVKVNLLRLFFIISEAIHFFKKQFRKLSK